MTFPFHGILFPVMNMKNIPVFACQGGTATLILREIPMSGRAYILLRTILPQALEASVTECARFCRICGAEVCFVSWDQPLPFLPHAYDILELHIEKDQLAAPGPVTLVPMNPDNDSIFQRIYNRCFQSVSHALSYDRAQIARIYQQGHAAFLALDEQGKPYGIGELHGNELAAVAVLPKYRGHGRDLTLSLLHRCSGPELTLTVASDNAPALSLYDKLGFRVKRTESSWYRIPDNV